MNRLLGTLRQTTGRLLYPTSLGLRLALLWKGASLRPRRPHAPWMNRTLKTREEYQATITQLRTLRLHRHFNPPKNWDGLAALDFILQHTNTTARILDAGGEVYSPLVEWLFLYGYRRLHAINLAFAHDFAHGPIQYRKGDCTATPYPSGHFDVVTCLSVIEHGVDFERFLRESHRILRDDGILIVSTDYWVESVDTTGLRAFDAPVSVFAPEDIRRFVTLAEALGFRPTGDIDYSARDRVVRWDEVGLDFTFIVFALVKERVARSIREFQR